MANTTNIDLVKPLGTDHALISVINSNYDKIDTEAGKVRANFAGTYSTSSAYAVGAYCIYQGNLYRCKTAIGSGGEAWTSGHWDQVSVGTELTTLNNQLTGITTRKTYNFIGSANVSVSRIGNMCYLSCIVGTYTNSSAGGRLTVTAGSDSEGLTLPSGYRPLAACEIKEANLGKRISVYTDGNIVCTEQITGQALRFSGCWMTLDAMPS